MAYFRRNYNQDENQNTTGTTGGNVYSTSSSEVSSTVDNTDNNKKSNTSGSGFVNLNKYLDANQGKVGTYASSFVNDDLRKGNQYKSDVNNAIDSYVSSVKSSPAYTYNDSTSSYSDTNLLKNYIHDSESLNQAEKNRITNVLKGYQGDDEFQNTGNKYGYNTLKKTSDEFEQLSNDIDKPEYLKTKMSNDLSTGGKNLDSFLLQADSDSRRVLDNAKRSFSDISKLLGTATTKANTTRNSVMEQSNKNAADFNEMRKALKESEEQTLRNAYNNAQTKTKQSQISGEGSVNKQLVLPNTNKKITVSIMNSPYVYDETKANSMLNNELAELEARYTALDNGVLDNNSRTDTNFNFGGWGSSVDNRSQVNAQIQRANQIIPSLEAAYSETVGGVSMMNEAIDLLSDANAETAAGMTARVILQQMIQGDYDWNEGIWDIMSIAQKFSIYKATNENNFSDILNFLGLEIKV